MTMVHARLNGLLVQSWPLVEWAEAVSSEFCGALLFKCPHIESKG